MNVSRLCRVAIVLLLTLPASANASEVRFDATVNSIVAKLPSLTAAIDEIRMIRVSVPYREGKIVDSVVARIRKRVDRLTALGPIIKKKPTITAVAGFRDDAEAVLRDGEELFQALGLEVANQHQQELLVAWQMAVLDATTPLISEVGAYDEAAYQYFEEMDERLEKCSS